MKKAFIIPTLDNEVMLKALKKQVPKDFKTIVVRGKGVAEAWNIGLKKAEGYDYFIISNDDIELCDGWWDKFEEAFRKYHFVCLDTTFPISGWFFAMDRYCFEKVGFFDEQFEGYTSEDADYAIRLKKAGIKIRKVDVPIKHYGSVTINKIPKNEFREVWNRNFIRLRKKHKDVRMTSQLI